MSRTARAAWLGAAVVVLIVAFVVLSPSDDTSDREPPSTTATATPESGPNAATTPTATKTPAAPQPLAVRVKGLEPVDGVQDLTVKQGQRVRFVVTSDQPEEIHAHGYDISREVGPGNPARYDFRADITGIFEVELEHAGVEILRLKVEP
jgi:hypothetical protein